MKLTINFQDDVKFIRDLNAFCELHSYQGEDTTQAKMDFVEKKFKEQFKGEARQRRLVIARENITVEE